MKLPKIHIAKFKLKIPKRKVTRAIMGIFFALIVAGGLFFFFNRSAEAAWFDDSWAYRLKYTFTNTGAAVASQKVKIDIDTATLITAGKMQADCGDSRFTDTNGIVLKYYLDSAGGACNGASTDYYVLVPTIAVGTTTIYHYYGNPSAVNGTEAAQFSEDTFSPAAGPTGASEEKTPGPSAYWKFDEGTGSTTQDFTVNNNDGILGTGTSAPTWTTQDQCVSEKCLKFDGLDDAVNATSTIQFDSGAFTISGWFKTTADTTGVVDQIWNSGYNNGNHDVEIYLQNNLIKFYARDSAGVGISASGIASTSTINDSKWHHFSAVRSGNTFSLYVDGLLNISVTTAVGDLDEAGVIPRIGNGLAGINSRYFNGFLDEIKIYHYARSVNEIKQDFVSRGSVHGVSVQMGDDHLGEILSNGLVGYWKMDENTGTSAADSSGNSNTGTLGSGTSAPTWSVGKFGSGLDFDGTNDYVDLGSTNTLDNLPNASFTTSVWFNADTLSTTNDVRAKFISKSQSADFKWHLGLRGTGSSSQLEFTIDNVAYARSSNTLSTDAWYNVTVVYDTNTKLPKMYLNGSEVTYNFQAPLTGSYSGDASNNIHLGQSINNADRFDGTLDETRIYNRAFSPDEVSKLYNWAPGPVGYWKLDENSGTSAHDSSGNNLTGTFVNSPTWAKGIFGSGVSFDRASLQHILVSDNPKLDITGSISASAWVKFKSLPGWSQILGKRSGVQNQANYAFRTGNSGSADELEFYYYNGSFQVYTTSNANMVTDQWYYLTVTRDGSNLPKIYKDGVLLTGSCTTGTCVPSMVADSNNFGIARSGDGNGEYGDAVIDDVRIYDYARTPAQIMQDMNASHPVVGTPVGSTMLHLKMDEGYGTSVIDWSPQKNNGTMGTGTSAPAWTNEGKFGKALDFDGRTDFVSFGDIANFEGFPMTISSWINMDVLPSTFSELSIVSKYHAATNDRAWRFIVDDLNDKLTFTKSSDGTSGNAEDVIANTAFIAGDIGKWIHVMISIDENGTYTFYKNGVPDGSGTFASTTVEANTAGVYVGAVSNSGTSPGRFFDGKLDDVKVYPVALTPEEARLEYNGGKAMVMGSYSTGVGGTGPSWSSDRSYCVPGDMSQCNPPVGEWKMDEKTGNTALDSSGNDEHGMLGTSTAAPKWTSGKYGNALQFDGNDTVTITDPADGSLDFGTGDFTLSAWAKAPPVVDFSEIITKDDDDGDRTGWSLMFSPTVQGRVVFQVYGGGGGAFHDGGYTDNVWRHYVGVRDGTDSRLYVNGVLVHTATGSNVSVSNATNIGIGYKYVSPAYALINGAIDDVKIYNYARTPAQIAWEYNQGKPVAWYKFDECQGTVIGDWAPNANGGFNGNTGTLVIGATGTNDAPGTCNSGDTTEAWNNGTTGKRNASIDLDGTDDYVTLSDPSNGSLDFVDGEDFTITFWANIPDRAAADAVISKKTSNGAGTTGYMLHIFAGEGLGFYSSDGTDQNLTSTVTALPTDTWTHVSVVYDDDTAVNYYFNGKPVASTSGQSALSTVDDIANGAEFRIGSESGTAELFLEGQMDDVRVFRYGLTADQIKAVMNDGAVRFD